MITGLSRNSRMSLAAIGVASAAMIALATPSAQADTTPDNATVSQTATAQARSFAKTHAEQVAAAENLCGAGYHLYDADALPSTEYRDATIFIYDNPAEEEDAAWPGYEGVCAVLDNNLQGAHNMELKLCTNKIGGVCHSDSGYYTYYAGPVKLTNKSGNYPLMCSSAHAYMESNSGSPLVNTSRYLTPCN